MQKIDKNLPSAHHRKILSGHIFAIKARIDNWTKRVKQQYLHNSPAFLASRVQHIKDMHSKFALRPHHVWKYGRHPISNRWD